MIDDIFQIEVDRYVRHTSMNNAVLFAKNSNAGYFPNFAWNRYKIDLGLNRNYVFDRPQPKTLKIEKLSLFQEIYH